VTRDSEALPHYRAAWLALGWLMVGAVGIGSLWPSMPGPAGGLSDKLLHFGAYSALAFVFAGAIERSRWWRIAFSLLALGIGIEIMQAFWTESRSAEWLDAAANTFGVATGLMSAALFPGGWCRQLESAFGAPGTRQ